MLQLLVKVKDKSRVKELAMLGTLRYVPKYSAIVCMECHPKNVKQLSEHPIVESVEEAPVPVIQ